MEITAAAVKILREKTGAGMMDCKKALTETEGDMEKAIDYLRKKGAATAEKRADRSANEGVIVTVTETGKSVILELNCETDFVARSEDFLALAQSVMDSIKKHEPIDVPALLDIEHEGLKIQEHVMNAVGKIGEKVEVKRFTTINTQGLVVDYIHPGSKLGVVVELSIMHDHPSLSQLGKDLAMQIAAMNPVAIDRDSVPKETQEKELELYRQQAREQGKPEQMLDRIAEGKLNKYFQEFTLLEQSFIRDNTKTVKEVVEEVAKQIGEPVTVVRFERFQVGQ
jgi:elongation factor Ts